MSDNEIKNKRWYDLDPTVSLAVNLFEHATDNVKMYIANYIIEEAKNRGARLNLSRKENFDYVWKRWQDSDEKMFEAMEYFKIIDFESKKQLSLEIIDYIRNVKNKFN